MKQKQIEQLKELIKEHEQHYDFNDYVFNYMDEDELKEMEISDLEDYMHDLTQDVCETEVIYYSNAIDYLKEHDPSLNESLEIADEYGYKTSQLNSELLASLLKSKNNRDDYYTFIQEVIGDLDDE